MVIVIVSNKCNNNSNNINNSSEFIYDGKWMGSG